MAYTIPYIKWRDHIEDITPADHRIGTDIVLIDHNDASSTEPMIDCEPFKVDMTMAIIYEQGWAELKINMQEYHVQAPAVLIVLNDQIYQTLGNSSDLRSKVILMSRTFSDGMFQSFGDSHPLYSSIFRNPVMKMENDQDVFSQYYELLLNIARSPRTDFKLESARHLTLAMFYGYSHDKHGVVSEPRASNRREDICERFMELLKRDYKNQRDLSYYADLLCITSKYLSQVMKDLTGKTALDCIEDYVISESKAMLSSTSRSIQQISDELNFPSQSVFGKYFKRVTGMSPKEYRKRR